MYPEVMAREQAELFELEKEIAVRLAKIAGTDKPEQRISPELTATIRFGDPALAALLEQKARVALNLESLEKLESVEPDTSDAPTTSIEDVDGVTPDIANALRTQGYESLEDLAQASDEDLLEVDGIGPAKLKAIREDVGGS